MRPLRLALALAVFALPVPAFAGDTFAIGSNAYSTGFFGSAARHWLDLAERGHGPAQYNIGRMHYYGQGVSRDRIEAYKWFLIAGENGVERSHEAARILSDRMTSHEVAEATLRARDWKSRRSEARRTGL
jgi:TPR repeat protein